MDISDTWPKLTSPPELASGEIHVCRIRVPEVNNLPDNWHTVLTREERERANRKRLPIDSRRTLSSRACLRLLLGFYLNLAPNQVKLTTIAAGKPILDHFTLFPKVEFNVSHSGDWILIGFTRDQPLGIDIEQYRELEFVDLAEQVFTPSERAQWEALESAQRARDFFRAWTRKEAYLKAIGLGLIKPLNSFSVTTGENGCIDLHHSHNNPISGNWNILDLLPAPEYIGAIATKVIPDRIKSYTFDYS
ncbi:MAG: 4'-phosphopantetheinyl transferase superfamily protein [Opitutaceae bacterium]